MEASLFKKYQNRIPAAAPAFRSERDELVQSFLGHEIQVRDRKTKQLVDATAADLALMLRNIPTAELYTLHRKCQAADTFSRLFWYLIREKTKHSTENGA